MSLANERPELTEPRVGEPIEDLIIPLKSMTKQEIEDRTKIWLVEKLSQYETPEMYVHLKQMEEAIKKAIEIIKEQAFNATATRYRGVNGGEVLGHKVKLTWPEKYEYSVAVKRLELQQKLEMDALKAQERADGIATKHPTKGVISVTITQ